MSKHNAHVIARLLYHINWFGSHIPMHILLKQLHEETDHQYTLKELLSANSIRFV